MASQTVLRELIQLKLGLDLREYVLDCRTEGISWRGIAREISAVVGVPVTDETLRRWFSEDPLQTSPGRGS